MACVTPDPACCEDWASFTPEQQELATLRAQSTLQALTAYRTALCPVLIRPCREGCGSVPTWMTFPVQSYGMSYGPGWAGGPGVVGGQWYNLVCGCGVRDCSCETICEVVLPTEVASVETVTLDGAELPPTAYRVDNGRRLVRTDGECWPLCQDMAAAISEPGTFAVEYTPGVALGPLGEAALGTLACEYAKAACGRKGCRLPANVTSVTRQGVSINFATAPFPGGLTGIREVDDFVLAVNPNRLVTPSVVWSPDLHRGRVPTWQG